MSGVTSSIAPKSITADHIKDGSLVGGLLAASTVTPDKVSVPVQVAVLTGTISNGGTIPLPSGYSEGQCKWTASPRYRGDSNMKYFKNDTCSTSGRVVTVNMVSDQGTHNGTANYMIVGVK